MDIKRLIFCIAIMACCIMVPLVLHAQADILQPTSDSLPADDRMDVIDLVKMMVKKKGTKKILKPKPENGPFITAIPYPGYTIATGFAGVAPINISFYTNKKERLNLSFFNNNFQYTQYKQILAQSISNLFLHHDKWELIGDWRYLNFPTYTYGLGIHTSADNQDRIDYSYIRFYENVMRKVANHVDIGIGYALDYHWNIKDFDADSIVANDFKKYGYRPKSVSSGFTLNLQYDSRNNVNNPMKGAYLTMQFRVNHEIFGSSSKWNSFTVDYRRYFPISTKHWESSIAVWSYMVFTVNGTPPYLDLPTTASDTYNNSGRGYALGRYRGSHMLYLEAEYRFGITPNGLLGGVVFANLQTVSDWPEINFTGVQPGIGFGLRLKINKHTNTNCAADYGFGTGGSKGLAFNLNEVF